MSFHVNPETGNPGRCSAQEGNCPFGGEADHFSTPTDARKAYEKVMAVGGVWQPLAKATALTPEVQQILKKEMTELETTYTKRTSDPRWEDEGPYYVQATVELLERRNALATQLGLPQIATVSSAEAFQLRRSEFQEQVKTLKREVAPELKALLEDRENLSSSAYRERMDMLVKQLKAIQRKFGVQAIEGEMAAVAQNDWQRELEIAQMQETLAFKLLSEHRQTQDPRFGSTAREWRKTLEKLVRDFNVAQERVKELREVVRRLPV